MRLASSPQKEAHSMDDETDKPRAYTQADLLRFIAHKQGRKAKGREMVNHPDAPYVFAPRSMWNDKGKGR
jgi:hypothetical protein